MRKKQKMRLSQMYPVSADGKTYILEAWLDAYEDIFNEWDPAPFRRRDIAPDLLAFLEACAEDIPLKYPLCVRFHIKGKLRDGVIEKRIYKGIRNYFLFSRQSERKKLAETNRRIVLYTLLSIGFLVGALVAVRYETDNLLLQTAVEGLFIGGWVFLWNAIETFFFDAQEIRQTWKFIDRFYAADYLFVNEEDEHSA